MDEEIPGDYDWNDGIGWDELDYMDDYEEGYDDEDFFGPSDHHGYYEYEDEEEY